METEFSQVTMDQNGEVLQSLSGTLSVQRPGKMRWQTNPPYEQLVVSDGESVWVYDMDVVILGRIFPFVCTPSCVCVCVFEKVSGFFQRNGKKL